MCSIILYIYSHIYGTGPSSWKNTLAGQTSSLFWGVIGWLDNGGRNRVAIADGRMTCRAQRKCPGIKYIAMMK